MADTVITPANVLASTNAQITYNGLAGAVTNAGDVIYRDNTDSNKIKPSSASGAAPANTVTGIALNSAAVGQPVAYVVSDPNFIPGGVLVPGTLYVLSATTGKMCPASDLASGDTAILLGVAKTATTMNFAPVAGGQVP